MPPTPPTVPTAEEPAPRFFKNPEEFRAWLARCHDQRSELWVGYWKKGTGEPSMMWAESVDVALCFGWIDGIRKSIDERRYKIRFTPRRPKSHWSARNLARMDDLLKADLVAPAGLAAYRNRDPAKVRQASYEQRDVALPPEYERELKTDPAAWRCWRAARPSYRKQVAWWIVSAKREETRRRRLKTLAEACAKGEVVPAMRWTEAGRNRSAASDRRIRTEAVSAGRGASPRGAPAKRSAGRGWRTGGRPWGGPGTRGSPAEDA